jgi:predicted RNA methylase
VDVAVKLNEVSFQSTSALERFTFRRVATSSRVQRPVRDLTESDSATMALPIIRDIACSRKLWCDHHYPSAVVLAVPNGLEVACIRLARREHDVKLKLLSDGLLISLPSQPRAISALLDAAPIWTFGSFHLVFSIENASSNQELLNEALADSISDTTRYTKPDHTRFWLTNSGVPNDTQDRIKRFILGYKNGRLQNDPGNYSITVRVHSDLKQTYVLLGSSISVKSRFPYRESDVPGSINPVLAACLVRMLPKALAGRAIDPTCGSGTLLIERLAYSEEEKGLGIDVSSAAQASYDANTYATKFQSRFEFRLGDARKASMWEDCSSVVCNLPFGIRVKASPSELRDLYAAVVANAISRIDEEGRILLATSFKAGLQSAIESQGSKAELLSKYRAEMGGLFYQIAVLKRA